MAHNGTVPFFFGFGVAVTAAGIASYEERTLFGKAYVRVLMKS